MRSRAIVLSAGPERDPSQPVHLPPAGEVAPHVALPWIVRLRYGLVLGEILTIAVAVAVLNVELPLAWLSMPVAVTAVSNYCLNRWQQGQQRDPEGLLGWIFGLDTLCLTAVLALCGGPLNPFSLLYLVQITVSAVVLRKAWTWVLGAMSTLCFGLLFWVHRPLAIFESHHQVQQFSVHLVGMWIAFAIAASLTAYFIGKVSEALRRREQEVLELQQQVARNQRLSSLVTLAAGAAHELGTPLASIAVVSKEIERALAGRDAEMAEDARLIRSEVERCRRILQNMSARGAETSGEAPAPVPLPDLLDRVRAQFTAEQQQSIRLEAVDEGAVLPPEATTQALAALVKNALDASGPQMPVTLSAERNGDMVRFTVRDEGSGMSLDVLNRIAEPFFTTKEPGRGMGLGVFLVRLFAERLSGRLRFESEAGRGTVVSLELPCRQVSMVSHVTL
ncbi:MAG: ATP-binding protein [Bryobacteraceae bacterium]